MTYITYKKAQYQIDTTRQAKIPFTRFQLFHKPLRKIPAGLPKPNFMPSYLVRTFDMKLVKGSQVHEGYCALSYSWNQSGKIVTNAATGQSCRIDQGIHKIIFKASKKVRKKPRGRKRIPGKIKFVTFNGLIQEICKDFNIKYIWYDQMCINQNDEKEKHREIHQMHNIYNSAYCTLALVPELSTEECFPVYWKNGMIFQEEEYFSTAEWMKRMWTLEEAVMSSEILFVGRDIHCWSEQLQNPIFHNESSYNAATILHYAHKRTSTKEHDRIFALANVFPDVIREMKIDYNQDVQELMIEFYGLLAKKDLSIMCFQMDTSFYNMDPHVRKEAKYKKTIQEFDLPSWTGVNGQHLLEGILKLSFENYTVSGRVLQITCRGFTNREHRILDMESIEDLIPPLPQQNLNKGLDMILLMHLRLPGTTYNRKIQVYTMFPNPYFTEDDIKTITEALYSFSYFFPIEKMDLQWVPGHHEHFYPCFDFNRLPLMYPDGQFVLLSGLSFTSDYGCSLSQYPVIKKDGDYYKAIGMCEIENDDGHFFDDMTLEEQTFKIH